ncbi:MAG: FliA/WhiG family RNA polymerase sigma factor [Calditrichaeota bacterium]|nr:FliA/WhiG family RNA polymerase sigma factor [Calditrichota bacterium]
MDRSDDMMEKYHRLVQYVVHRHFRASAPEVPREELVQAGMIGLSEARERYDPALGVKFETFAYLRIRGAISDELRRQGRLTRTQMLRSRRIARAQEMLAQEHQQEIGDEAVAARLGVSTTVYAQWQAELHHAAPTSLDQPLTAQSRDNFYQVMENRHSSNPQTVMETHEQRRQLLRQIRQLPEKYRLMIVLYYYEQLNFREIGEVLQVSESRISQMHSRVMERLKRKLSRG